jgi:hypothetical protein
MAIEVLLVAGTGSKSMLTYRTRKYVQKAQIDEPEGFKALQDPKSTLNGLISRWYD